MTFGEKKKKNLETECCVTIYIKWGGLMHPNFIYKNTQDPNALLMLGPIFQRGVPHAKVYVPLLKTWILYDVFLSKQYMKDKAYQIYSRLIYIYMFCRCFCPKRCSSEANRTKWHNKTEKLAACLQFLKIATCLDDSFTNMRWLNNMVQQEVA